MVVFHSIFNICCGPPLSYLHERNLENKKKLMLLQIMNNDGLNSKNIVNCVSTFNDIYILIVIQGNNHEMDSVSCESSWDE